MRADSHAHDELQVQGAGERRQARDLLYECNTLCSKPETASVALAVGGQGMMGAVAEWCLWIAESSPNAAVSRMSPISKSRS